mmetsp:Transcript_8391/g.17776  ORF Transcript_8391/g.17776 Transcript_8391/m.17776 type:complete len:240 (+) Transcript_8391:515-1234(+)
MFALDPLLLGPFEAFFALLNACDQLRFFAPPLGGLLPELLPDRHNLGLGLPGATGLPMGVHHPALHSVERRSRRLAPFVQTEHGLAQCPLLALQRNHGEAHALQLLFGLTEAVIGHQAAGCGGLRERGHRGRKRPRGAARGSDACKLLLDLGERSLPHPSLACEALPQLGGLLHELLRRGLGAVIPLLKAALHQANILHGLRILGPAILCFAEKIFLDRVKTALHARRHLLPVDLFGGE